ncbi:hypothetical protein ACIGXM_07715 [Kitasatospora sp. NPDC052896]|uniref:hypothetical protein n=1 Tax=Kitasatospora sp. NPDC052896 TaxID=3364061 RepID=UPI0037C5A049
MAENENSTTASEEPGAWTIAAPASAQAVDQQVTDAVTQAVTANGTEQPAEEEAVPTVPAQGQPLHDGPTRPLGLVSPTP